MNQYLKELKDFLKSIDTDFYLHLHEYKHYADTAFDGSKLTLTQLVLIAESHAALTNQALIHNFIDISALKAYIFYRISLSKDMRLITIARNIIRDMDFYSYQPVNTEQSTDMDKLPEKIHSDLDDKNNWIKEKYGTYI